MKASLYARNILADGQPYLAGFLGLDWFPSERAKANAENYEAEVLYAINTIYRRFTGSRVILEIGRYSRRVVVRPRAIPPVSADDDAISAKFNALTTPTNWRDGAAQGVRVRGNDSRTEDWNLPLGTGLGSDAEITINPGVYRDYGGSAPAYLGTSDDVLLHELVHGLADLVGRSNAGSAPACYKNGDEFAAFTVANVYRSEKFGASAYLVGSIEGTELAPERRDGKAFYDAYKQYMDQLCAALPGLAGALKLGSAIKFNPFAYCPV